MLENYNGSFEIGKDCLNPEVKRAKIEAKARALEGNPISDEEILKEAFEKAQDSRYKGPVDPGPLSD